MPAIGAVLNGKNCGNKRKIPLERAGFFFSETTFKSLWLFLLHISCCFKEQRYKINASNSQLSRQWNDACLGCFKEQRYKINASNSQLRKQWNEACLRCFKEQRYKINASNSQPKLADPEPAEGCFKEQRYKINASNSQHRSQSFLSTLVVSKSKDTR